MDLLEKIDLNDVLFNVLKQKNIAYDIRTAYTDECRYLFNSSVPGLEKLESLGISPSDGIYRPEGCWKIAQDHFFEIQKKARNSLFFLMRNQKQVVDNLLILISTCRNISTLDLNLSTGLLNKIDFSSLKTLHSLRHIFLRIEKACRDLPKSGKASNNLFESLALCQKAHQGFLTFSLDLNASVLSRPEHKPMAFFFETCADTLQKVILGFNYVSYKKIPINIFYDGLSRLKQVQSLTIVILEARDEATKQGYLLSHYTGLGEALRRLNSLEELSFYEPGICLKDREETYQGISQVKRLSLKLAGYAESVKHHAIHSVMNFSCQIEHLGLDLPVKSLDHLERLLICLDKQPNLESVKIMDKSYYAILDLKGMLEIVLRSHKRLQFLAFGKKLQYQDSTLWNLDKNKEVLLLVLKKRKYWTDIGKFYPDLENDLKSDPVCRSMVRIYSYDDEMSSLGREKGQLY